MTCNEYKDEIIKSYRLVKVLSQNNGSTVLHLRNLALERDLILRLYPRVIPAYEILKTVKHENIPEIYDSITLDDGYAVLEEYVEGITVAEVLECGKYTYRGAKKVLEGVCSAMAYLHSRQIIHRDVKPENIIVDKNGKVVLIDLNASRLCENKKSHDTEVLGTIGYASPEQFGIAESDARSDIYSLGILLNVMLTGEHPSKLLAKGKAGRIVLKCTSIDPERRFASVENLLMVI